MQVSVRRFFGVSLSVLNRDEFVNFDKQSERSETFLIVNGKGHQIQGHVAYSVRFW